MAIIYNFRTKGWNANKFIINKPDGKAGEMRIYSTIKYKANAELNKRKWQLKETNLFGTRSDLLFEHKKVGSMRNNVLKLADGQSFSFHQNLWGSQFYWKDQNHQKVIQFNSPYLGANGYFKVEAPTELESYLSDALSVMGIFHKHKKNQKSAFIAIFIPVITAIIA